MKFPRNYDSNWINMQRIKNCELLLLELNKIRNKRIRNFALDLIWATLLR